MTSVFKATNITLSDLMREIEQNPIIRGVVYYGEMDKRGYVEKIDEVRQEKRETYSMEYMGKSYIFVKISELNNKNLGDYILYEIFKREC